MTQDRVTGAQSWDVDSDHPNHTFSDVQFLEKVDENVFPEVVKHLSTAGEWPTSTSSQNIGNHIQVDSNALEAKRTKIRETRKRYRANRRKKRELSRNLTSLNDSTSPSTLRMQESSIEISSFGGKGKVDENAVPEVVKHLSTAGVSPTFNSSQNVENHTQVDSNVLEAKKMKIREMRKRYTTNRRKKRELSRNLASVNNRTPSTLRMQVNSIEISSFEPSDLAPASTHVEELVEEVVEHSNAAMQCSAASSTKDSEGHTQLDNNSESKEIKLVKRRKRVRTSRYKKRKLSSNSSLPSKEDAEGALPRSTILEVSNLVPAAASTEELMISFHKSSYLIKDNTTYPVGRAAEGDKEKEIKIEILNKSLEEHGILCDTTAKDVSEKCSVLFGKDKPDSGSDKLNTEPKSHDGITLSLELSETHPAALGVCNGKLRKKLLVLDFNGLLMDIVNYASKKFTPDTIISRKAVFRRPFCDDFLRFCFEKFHVGVWSSRTKKNLKSAIDFLMGEMKSKLLFCWNQTHCTKTGFYTLENREKPMLLKELKKLWEKHEPSLPWERGDYNESNTLLLDDSPYKALHNPPYTAIFPNPFCYKDVNDKSLGPGGDLRVYLEGLASADDVRKYVEANPYGQRAITNTNASWNFYSKVIQDNSSPARKFCKRNWSTLHQ